MNNIDNKNDIIIKEPKFVKIKGVPSPYGDFLFELVDRPKVTRVLLFNEDYSKVLLIKQYRPGVGKEIYEFPAGLLEPELTPEENMFKELKEETGYSKDQVEDVNLITTGYSSPGFTNEFEYIFAAKIKKGANAGIRKLEDNEHITDQDFYALDEAEKLLENVGIKSAYSLLKWRRDNKK